MPLDLSFVDAVGFESSHEETNIGWRALLVDEPRDGSGVDAGAAADGMEEYEWMVPGGGAAAGLGEEFAAAVLRAFGCRAPDDGIAVTGGSEEYGV